MTSLAWLGWAVLVMATALSTTNPFYLALVALALCVVVAAVPLDRSSRGALRLAGGFALVMFVLSIGIAVINGSPGDHVLVRIPSPELPGWLGGLALGGPVTAEALVAAAIRGLAIACVIGAFAVFNAAARPQDVLRLAPATLFHAGLVLTVGLSLLPASVADLQRLREIRALRGAPGGFRGLPSLVTPTVTGGLERSMRLAEALEARGYAAGRRSSRTQRAAGLGAAPLLLAAAGCWFYYPDLQLVALLAAGAGLGLLGLFVFAGGSGRRSRLNEEEGARFAGPAGKLSLAGAALVVAGSTTGFVRLGYSPFAGLEVPAFSPVEAALTAALAWPALFLPWPALEARGAESPSRPEAEPL